MKAPPRRIALPDCPTPTAPALADHYYPGWADIVSAGRELVLGQRTEPRPPAPTGAWLDVPDRSFTGPF
jgi:hypothetical protein